MMSRDEHTPMTEAGEVSNPRGRNPHHPLLPLLSDLMADYEAAPPFVQEMAEQLRKLLLSIRASRDALAAPPSAVFGQAVGALELAVAEKLCDEIWAAFNAAHQIARERASDASPGSERH